MRKEVNRFTVTMQELAVGGWLNTFVSGADSPLADGVLAEEGGKAAHHRAHQVHALHTELVAYLLHLRNKKTTKIDLKKGKEKKKKKKDDEEEEDKEEEGLN